MAISDNPTKTRTIEAAFRRENKRRFTRYARYVRDLTNRTQDRTVGNSLVTNAPEPFSMTDAEYEAYKRALRNGAYRDIMGVNNPSNANSSVEWNQTDQWQGVYINAAYARGIDSARTDLRREGIDAGVTMRDLRDLFDVGTDQRAAQMLIGTNALHGETISSLQQTTLITLVQATETMLAQINRDVEAARATVNPKTVNVIQDLVKRVSVANSAGETNASTTTVQSFQRAQINNAGIVSEETGVEVKLRWLTRRDNRVRHLHASWHGKVMTQEEASENIQESPWNCRCGFAQVPPVADTEKRQEMFDKERKQLLDEENS